MKHSLPPTVKRWDNRRALSPGDPGFVEYHKMSKSRPRRLQMCFRLGTLGDLTDEYDLFFQKLVIATTKDQVEDAWEIFVQSARIKHGSKVDEILESIKIMESLGWLGS